MKLFRAAGREPLWQDEFSIHTADERYVSRRQFTKFLVLTSLGMFAGNAWILVRSCFSNGNAKGNLKWTNERHRRGSTD